MVLSDKLVNYCSFMFMLISVSKYVSVFMRLLRKSWKLYLNLILKTLIIDTNWIWQIYQMCKLVGKMLGNIYPPSSLVCSHLSSK